MTKKEIIDKVYQIQRKNTPPSIGSEMILRLAGSEPDSGRVLALR